MNNQSAELLALVGKMQANYKNLHMNGYETVEGIAAGVKEALASLPPTASPPKLACLGLTGRQSWFLKEVAAAAGTTAWEPDMTKLAAGLGLSFAESAPVANFSSTSAGLMGLVGAKVELVERGKVTTGRRPAR